MYFVFGGDDAGVVLATLLMSTFYTVNKHSLVRSGLRWGFFYRFSRVCRCLQADHQLINLHVNLGVVCLVVLLIFYLWGIKHANQTIKDKELENQRACLVDPFDSSGSSASSTI